MHAPDLFADPLLQAVQQKRLRSIQARNQHDVRSRSSEQLHLGRQMHLPTSGWRMYTSYIVDIVRFCLNCFFVLLKWRHSKRTKKLWNRNFTRMRSSASTLGIRFAAMVDCGSSLGNPGTPHFLQCMSLSYYLGLHTIKCRPKGVDRILKEWIESESRFTETTAERMRKKQIKTTNRIS